MIKQKGFTLIELLIAVGILMLLVSVGIANYIGFNERQKLIQAAEIIRESVAFAQTYARSGKIKDCERLIAYQVSFSAGSEIVSVSPICESGGSAEINEFNLPSGVELANSNDIFFRAISGSVTDDLGKNEGEFTQLQITISNSQNQELIMSIDRSGSLIIEE